MHNALLLSTCLCLVASAAFAEVTPRRGAHDARVREALFVDGQVYTLMLMLERVTTVEFPRNEEIVSVVAGDTESFDFDAVPGGRAFVIKPKRSGARTNITVFTNRRSYYFTVQESRDTAFYAVRFTVPSERDQGTRTQVAAWPPNLHYGANAMNAITPREVWDDGSFTYFRFHETGEMPAIFAVSDGMERVVNAQIQRDGSVRVSGTSPYWVLRLGKTETTIADLKVPQ
ncbi:TrbG/VirB9 family P-type conjugative transfer protein [Roseinatronobacter alkalisoli]|uniref:TrbG/VirB9 family P-type conjugative transfer protein n=1 Tax=Roseinatronobacter alkalisoli TaxID=3028235 RepID=A0ABT5TA65_9RHOB|nr:TrbG/VirB9 family P-type conjugative transfer protein [Roseinatronobacter sp. HJB301]MDD7972007.1 TrbG/VirB9 family P-type conjugative transfer protein [Roseinatronobacter sp. HJB301]